ncbi:hypothetical protein ACFQ8C_10110 [Streptomyces sp. NPDC056503]|uniref:hypothetical protein n=1 Tax=Streptomyces sp. NPDC056503 TaxID=3345842 RepID=UPI00367B1AE5
MAWAIGITGFLSVRTTPAYAAGHRRNGAAIALHALTDPTSFLAAGGVDEAVTPQSGGVWSPLTLDSAILMVLALVAVFLVTGRGHLLPVA